ncbi:MAG: hypothetical protein HEQ38_02650 [Gemmatimonas sp.]|uniref:hypothetical protein n=1 Tax=Gemmatimonas sp. TaxID=1962908 RepID=UPI0031C11466|nr:hypothetical protein [Gemmatimonas sp.]
MSPSSHVLAVRSSPALSGILRSVRSWLERYPRVAWSVRAGRAIVHFGPWRHLFRAAIRVTRPRQPGGLTPTASLLAPIDVAEAVGRLREESVYVAGVLPPELLARIRAVTDGLPVDAYTHANDANADVQALVSDPAILSVLRAHFGCEPVLLECTLGIVEPDAKGRDKAGPQRWFHFDFGGWQSLTLFVYLTDVDGSAAPHEVAAGTHQRRGFRDAVRSSITDAEAYRRFGAAIRTITGPAGTMFFEDTEAFHRRAAVGRRRVMLNVLYASHRGLFSHGRPGLSLRRHLTAAAAATTSPR